MVANMSDDDIWRLNRGGHDAHKVFAAYAAAMRAQGPAHGHPREDGEGLRPRQGRRRPDGRAPAEEARRGSAARRARPLQHPAHRRAGRRSSRWSSRPTTAPEMKYLHERRKALGGYLPARKIVAQPLVIPELSTFSAHARGHGRSRDLHHDGVRAHPHAAAQGQEHRQEHRAHRAGRGAHLRHGRPVPPDRHLQLGGPALHAGRFRPAHVLPRGQEGPDARRGHQRGGLDLLVDRGRHGLREPRHAHGAVLHLLLDVRLPARRRLLLGRGRPAHARLPVGRHRRPHHAGGRGPAAPGRPQPAARGHGAELRRLRSDLCLRARRDHPRRHEAHVRRTTRASSITSR